MYAHGSLLLAKLICTHHLFSCRKKNACRLSVATQINTESLGAHTSARWVLRVSIRASCPDGASFPRCFSQNGAERVPLQLP